MPKLNPKNFRLRNIGIGIRATIAVLSIAGVSITASVLYILNLTESTIQDSIEQQSSLLVQSSMNQVDQRIHNRIEVISSYSSDLILKNAVQTSNQQFEQMIDREKYITQKDKEWISASEGETTSFIQEILNNTLSEELREKAEFFENEYGYEIFPEIFITNKYGVVVAATGKTSDYFQADEEWYQETIKEERYWIGDIEYDKSADTFALDFIIKLHDEADNFIGIIKAVLSVEDIVNIVKEMESQEALAHKSHQTMEFKLLTKDGKIIYSSEGHEFLETVTAQLLSHLDQHPEYSGSFIGEGDQVGEGKELYAYTRSRGHGDFEGLGWILVIEHETKELFAPARQSANRASYIFIPIGILASIAYLAMANKAVIKPIKNLTKAAREVAQGNLKKRAEAKSKNEIGQLAESFNQMADYLINANKTIRQYAKQLEQEKRMVEEKVKQRTQELAESQEKISELNEILKLLNKTLRHDILNDITVTEGTISELSEAKGSKKGFEDILAAIDRSKGLINKMRDLETAISTGKELSPIKAQDIINKTVKEFPDIEFDVKGDAVIMADEAFSSAIYNIFGNAKIHGKTKKIGVEISTKDNTVEIRIADYGKGIPDNIKTELFAEGAKFGETGHTGLGLYIVKKTIERYGGKIWIEDNQPKGAVFALSLPKAKTSG